ncbi:MAG: rhomboid family intramembrane serine protease [Deltaproteobacteria bacterium]|nr:rhomboid family intramembrane serine protease [Deltaproteobacteria bacterium]
MVIFQRRMPPVVAGLIAATLLLSIACAVDARSDGQLYAHLALWPERVWAGEVWRLATWPFVQTTLLSLVFGCITLFGFGAELEDRWGSARMFGYMAAVLTVAGAGTALIALAAPEVMAYPHLGGWARTSAIVVAWSLQFPERRILFYGLIPLGGTDSVTAWCALTVVIALFIGFAPCVPELLATGAAVLAMTGGLRGVRTILGKRRGKPRIVRDDDDPRWMN